MINPLRWFGLADRQAKAPEPPAAEIGTTGTPFFSGYLRDLGEYNPALEGLAAFAVYEKMRRSDAQVAATLMAMKLPLLSAEWTVSAPANPTPVEREAADLVRACLFEEIKFSAVLRNALLMLDFGCSAHEEVWRIDGNRVRIAKLAPRPPVTFQRWITDQDEGLVAIEQYGAKGQTYVTATVPAEKLALFTHEQEGSNFAGRSVLRACYQHWYIKSNLYKIDAIAAERNGMGVPYIIMGTDAKKEDRETALAYVAKLSTHEKAGVVLPNGWTFGLKGVEGATRDPQDAMAHHNMMIAMSALAQFMMLGQSSGGNRALGESLGDFFYLALQATAKTIEQELSRTTIRRLVDFNFAGITRYPRITAQKIQAIKFEMLHMALKGLSGVGLVQGDDELESYLRKMMGLPRPGQTPRLAPPAGQAQVSLTARPAPAPAAAQPIPGEGSSLELFFPATWARTDTRGRHVTKREKSRETDYVWINNGSSRSV
jgi:phage gp29-like protein